jgi:hypothetical protein
MVVGSGVAIDLEGRSLLREWCGGLSFRETLRGRVAAAHQRLSNLETE